MGKHLVLAGGGHAHLMLLARIKDVIRNGHAVTVIQPSDFHYYSGMGPALLGGMCEVDDLRFATRYVVERQGGRFVRGRVTHIDPVNKRVTLENSAEIGYDVLSCNTGSSVAFANVHGDSGNVFPAKPIERLLEARRATLACCSEKSRPNIAVVGGGPAAVEIIGNLRRVIAANGHAATLTLFAGTELLGRFPRRIRQLTRQSLAGHDIAIYEGERITDVLDGQLITTKRSLTPDLIILATGVKPSSLFADSRLPIGPSGGLLVNQYLQSTAHPDIFGGGDCIDFAPQPLAKVGVYAVRQNPVLSRNVLAQLNDNRLLSFDPGGNFLLLFNLGDGTAIFSKGNLVFRARLAMTLKNFIDTRFMRHFQALEH